MPHLDLEKLQQFSQRLKKDESAREEFLRNPVAVLEEHLNVRLEDLGVDRRLFESDEVKERIRNSIQSHWRPHPDPDPPPGPGPDPLPPPGPGPDPAPDFDPQIAIAVCAVVV